VRERNSIINNIDGILFFSWMALALLGVVAIYSASDEGSNILNILSISGKHGKQLLFLGLSFVAMFFIWALDQRLLINLTPFIYIGALVLLLLTLFIGSEINGSKSWIKLGSVQIQPAEFAKLATSLMVAYIISKEEHVFKDIRSALFVFAILALPMALILVQGDFGSMMIYTILIFVFFREGLTPIPIFIGLFLIAITLTSIYFGFWKVTITIALIAGLIFFISKQKRKLVIPLLATLFGGVLSSLLVNTFFTNILKDYQQDRILVLLGMKEDLRGAGYSIWQSKMAIGSGGFVGKGYLQGTQTHGDFVPEVSTDYIFSSIGEEWGFIGSLVVIGLFSTLIFRILHLAESQKSRFARVFMYCAASIFFMHAFINIAMVTGLFPTVGIPLPFFSYGGSSLLAFSLIIAVVLRLNAENTYILG